jgi:uncharacterized protein (TIGR02265 family)
MFVEPRFNAPIDFEARLAAIPPSSVVRGMFLQLLQQSIGAEVAGELRDRRYVAFKNYPMREYVELLAACCADRNLRVPPGQRIRQLGRAVYPAYARTITGTAIFAVAGHNYRRVLELSPTAYRVSVESAKVSVRSITEGHAIVELRELWNLPDLHQVGIFEGAMLVCNARGTIRVEPIDFGSANLEITWQDSARS